MSLRITSKRLHRIIPLIIVSEHLQYLVAFQIYPVLWRVVSFSVFKFINTVCIRPEHIQLTRHLAVGFNIAYNLLVLRVWVTQQNTSRVALAFLLGEINFRSITSSMLITLILSIVDPVLFVICLNFAASFLALSSTLLISVISDYIHGYIVSLTAAFIPKIWIH